MSNIITVSQAGSQYKVADNYGRVIDYVVSQVEAIAIAKIRLVQYGYDLIQVHCSRNGSVHKKGQIIDNIWRSQVLREFNLG